jgi:hypothetical protein
LLHDEAIAFPTASLFKYAITSRGVVRATSKPLPPVLLSPAMIVHPSFPLPLPLPLPVFNANRRYPGFIR